MSLGRAIRTRLGRFEVPVSTFHRGRFIDLDACAGLLARAADAESILEIGCGDGQLAGPLLDAFPRASYVGIDVAPEVGRLFRGDAERARFASTDSRSFLAGTDGTFDLVLVVDVLHHVPVGERGALLDDVRELTTAGGHYALKDWVGSRSPWHYLAWASDRFLTGDRVRYFEHEELRGLVPARHATDQEILCSSVPPRANNVLLVYRRS